LPCSKNNKSYTRNNGNNNFTQHLYADQLKNDKIDKIENQLEQLKNEKLQIIEKAYDKDLLLDSILPKSENLKRSSLEMKYKIKKKLDTVKKTSLKFYIIGLFLIIVNIQ
jgi:hypothetical protein